MRKRTQTLIWTGVTVVSLSLHVVAFGGLSPTGKAGGGGKRKPAPTLVEMTVAPPPPPPVAPPAAPEKVKVARLAARTPSAPKAPPAPAPAAPLAETPADFTGTTLTNDGPGAGFAAATGNGEAMRGPVGTPGAKETGRSAAGASDSGPRVVGVGDLSRLPEAPALGSLLERYYPAEARRQGIRGKALVRARIMPDGQVRELAVLSESNAGFGVACRQTLQGSRWSPPIDAGGAAVSTYVNYTCRFEVY